MFLHKRSMLAKIHAMTMIGLESIRVEVEVDINKGLPKFHIVGLADTAVQESKQRVFSAIRHSGMQFPQTKITVNLAPADIKKAGPLFDLPISVGILLASEQLDFSDDLQKSLFLGEVALDGRLRHVSGVLPIVSAARKMGFTQVFLPKENAAEASLVEEISVFGANTLAEVIAHLNGHAPISPETSPSEEVLFSKKSAPLLDFSAIVGQEQSKRALEIAAAGSHNILMNGSPGSGKTLMAKAFPSILPRLTREEAFAVTEIYSAAGLLPPNTALMTTRPFRTIHHTASSISLVGGGRNPSPGEISLAHNGVLFLDEVAEFPPQVLEVLRQPLEDRKITVSRVSGSGSFPAHFTLVAAMNPCPCGYYRVPNADKQCTCPPQMVQKYQKKLSGPFLDRIDLYVDVSPVKVEALQKTHQAESSETIAIRVQRARDIQTKRFETLKIHSNAEMSPDHLTKFCPLPENAKAMLSAAVKQFSLSARSYHRVIKVARTIADLEEKENIELPHIAEALQYRMKVSE